jgi:hypothetical protein
MNDLVGFRSCTVLFLDDCVALSTHKFECGAKGFVVPAAAFYLQLFATCAPRVGVGICPVVKVHEEAQSFALSQMFADKCLTPVAVGLAMNHPHDVRLGRIVFDAILQSRLIGKIEPRSGGGRL